VVDVPTGLSLTPPQEEEEEELGIISYVLTLCSLMCGYHCSFIYCEGGNTSLRQNGDSAFLQYVVPTNQISATYVEHKVKIRCHQNLRLYASKINGRNIFYASVLIRKVFGWIDV
jgi:hypothetical protein